MKEIAFISRMIPWAYIDFTKKPYMAGYVEANMDSETKRIFFSPEKKEKFLDLCIERYMELGGCSDPKTNEEKANLGITHACAVFVKESLKS